MLVTLGTYRVKWINNNVWFRCSVSHGGSSSIPPDKDCHLVPGPGISPGCYEYDTCPLSWDTKGIRTKRTSQLLNPRLLISAYTQHIAYLVIYVASHAGILSWSLRIRCFIPIFADSGSHPSLPFLGLSVGKYGVRWIFSTEFPSVWRCRLAAACRGGSRSQGCPGYLLAMPEALSRLPSNH